MEAKKRNELSYLFVFLTGIFLFLSPVLKTIDKPILAFSLPVSSIYIFLVWIVIIVLLALLSSQSKDEAP
jgi:hypothetical protein